MARLHHRGRHRNLDSVTEIDTGLSKLRERIPQLEELRKDGLPYLDALRVKAEFQLRETVKEVFGDKSPEFEEHRHYRIKSCTQREIDEALALVRHLLALLEDKKLDLADGGHRYAERAAGGITGRAAAPPPEPEQALSSPRPMPGTPADPPPTPIPAQPPVAPQPQLVRRASPPQAPQVSSANPSASAATSRGTAPPPNDPPSRLQTVPTEPPPAQAVAATPSATVHDAPLAIPPDPLGVIRKICARFHPVARQLRQRQQERTTLEVEDERDVQDVMRALLCLDFDEIGSEEWVPTYANGHGRDDIVLEQVGIVVQVKRTRHGVGTKELTTQLAMDIQHYITHPTCQTLFCFIYDPEGRIGNPRALENKLTGEIAGRRVEVQISPK